MSVKQEIKFLLSGILNSEDKSLRVRTLEDTMQMLSETEMPREAEIIEKAIKLELKNKRDKVNNLIEDVLNRLKR